MRHSLASVNLKDGTLPPTDLDLERELENLDLSDDRIDPDGIVRRRLTKIGHNELLMRQARASGVISIFSFDSENEVPPLPTSTNRQAENNELGVENKEREGERESTYTAVSGYTIEAETVYEGSPTQMDSTPTLGRHQNGVQTRKGAEENDLVRASVQTYESSILTYGSMSTRSSRALSETDGETSRIHSEEEEERLRLGRPRAPLPWAPRGSALERVAGTHTSTSGSHPVSSTSFSGIPTAVASLSTNGSLLEATRPRAMSMNTGLNTGVNSGTGRRPLPPLPTPVSATFSNTTESRYSGISSVRDSVSLSLPGEGISRSMSNASTASKYSVASSASAGTGSQGPSQVLGGKKIRPLPRTPSAPLSLPEIAEDISNHVRQEERAAKVTSMIVSPTTGESSGLGRRRSRTYSTLGYGYGAGSNAKARAGIMDMFSTSDAVLSTSTAPNDESKGNDDVEESGASGKRMSTMSGASIRNSRNRRSMKSFRSSRAMSIRSIRSVRSSRSIRSTAYFVPDVDELVRILDDMDPEFDTSGDFGEDAAWVDLDSDLDLGDIDFKRVRGPTTPTKKRRTEVTGLLTPAATPRASPRKKVEGLPANSSGNPPTHSSTAVRDVVVVNQDESMYKDDDTLRNENVSPGPSSAGAFSLGNFPLPPSISSNGVAFPSFGGAIKSEVIIIYNSFQVLTINTDLLVSRSGKRVLVMLMRELCTRLRT